MWVVSKWPVPLYIKGVIIYSTLDRSRENSRDEKKYRKNESDNDHTFFQNF